MQHLKISLNEWIIYIFFIRLRHERTFYQYGKATELYYMFRFGKNEISFSNIVANEEG